VTAVAVRIARLLLLRLLQRDQLLSFERGPLLSLERGPLLSLERRLLRQTEAASCCWSGARLHGLFSQLRLRRAEQFLVKDHMSDARPHA
jgi:hypothetical protein